MVHNLWHASDFIPIFSKGHNSRKGDNSDKKGKKKKESIYEISKPFLEVRGIMKVLKDYFVEFISKYLSSFTCISLRRIDYFPVSRSRTSISVWSFAKILYGL